MRPDYIDHLRELASAPARLRQTAGPMFRQANWAAAWTAVGRWHEQRTGRPSYAVSEMLAAKRRRLTRRRMLRDSRYVAHMAEATGLLKEWDAAGRPGFNAGCQRITGYLLSLRNNETTCH